MPNADLRTTVNAALAAPKGSEAYREAVEKLVPADGAFEFIVGAVMEAIHPKGKKKTWIECKTCGKRHVYEVGKDPDVKAALKMLELLVAKPDQKHVVEGRIAHLHKHVMDTLSEAVPVNEITLHYLDPKDATRREEFIEAARQAEL